MLTNLTNKNNNNRSLINVVYVYASYTGHTFQMTRGLLDLSLRRRLRKTPTGSSSGPSEEGCMGAAAKASFHNRYY